MLTRAELSVPPEIQAGTEGESTARPSQLVAVSLEGLPVQILSCVDALSAGWTL